MRCPILIPTGSSGRAGARLAKSKPATAVFRALVQRTCICRFGFTRSCPLRFAKEVATRTEVRLGRRGIRAVRLECRTGSFGQSLRSDQAGRSAEACRRRIERAG